MPSHIIIRRRYSADTGSYSYDSVSDTLSLASANKRALAIRGTPGDLLIVCDMAYISDMPQYAKSIYAIDASGKPRKAPKLHERIKSHKTWLSAWEGVDAKADDMLYAAESVGVDHKLVVLAACACARTALKYMPVGENRPRIAIETTEAWTRGEATLEQVKKARKDDAARAYSASASASAVYSASASAASAAAYSAAASAARASGDYDTTIRELSELVREIIPLSMVIATTI